MMKLQALLSTTVLASGLMLASPAAAQASSSATFATPTTDSGEIVVTAQKRQESAQKVPVSLTVLSEKALSERHLNSIEQITLAAPSLQLGSDNTFAIRGVGTLAFSVNLDSSVAISYDDVNLGKAGLVGDLFNDVARVEVLNGPQGLLFGKNATSGLLNVVTTKPQLNKTELSFDIEYDNRDTAAQSSQGVFARSAINLPVSQNSALRLNLLYDYQEPITQYVGGGAPRVDTDTRNFGIRAKYLIQPSDALEVYLIGEYSEQHGTAGYYDRTYRAVGSDSINTPFIAASNVTPGTNNLQYAGEGSSFRDNRIAGAQIDVNYKFDNGMQISNIAAWKYFKLDSQFDTDFTIGNGASLNRQNSKYNQFTNELRLSTPSNGPFFGQIGLYYLHSKIDNSIDIEGNSYFPPFLLPTFPFCVGATTLGAPPFACPVRNVAFLGTDSVSTEKADSYAMFGQATYNLTSALRLIAGARLTHDTKSFVNVQQQKNYFINLGLPGAFSDRISKTDFSWKLGAQYDVARDIMAYGSFSRGYKAPGFNLKVSTTSSEIVNAETVNTAEIGLKSRLFDRKLTFNVSLFHSKYKNYQSQSFDAIARNFIISNAASVTSKGAEVSFDARPIEGLSLNGSFSFLDSKFGDYPGAQCYNGQPTPSCAVNGTFNAVGLSTPTSPKFTSSLQAKYERPLTSAMSGFVEINHYHRSSQNFLINQAPGAGIGATNILGGSLGLHGEDGGWSVAVFCKNCTDQRVPNSIGLEAGDQANGKLPTYQQQFGYNSSRTIGFTLGGKF